MILKPALAAMLASGLVVPEKPKLVFPKPAIVQAGNLEMSRDLLLGMPITLGMLAGKVPNPTIVSSNSSSVTTAGTSHAVSLPASIVAGNLLFVCHASRDNVSHTWPAGWTELDDFINAGLQGSTIGWRVADGTEGATMTITSSGSTQSSRAISVQVSGSSGAPNVSTVTNSTVANASPDTGSVTRKGGLFLTMFSMRETVDVTTITAPTNYTTVAALQGATGGVVIALAQRSATATPEDPGAWTTNAGNPWLGWTAAF